MRLWSEYVPSSPVATEPTGRSVPPAVTRSASTVMRGTPAPVVDAVTVPSTVAAIRSSGMFSAPLRRSVLTALAGGSVRRSSVMTNRKMNAHSSTIDARVSAVRRPRGILGRWRNVARCSTSTSPTRAVTTTVRLIGSPNHARLPRSTISTGASCPWGSTTLLGSTVQSTSRVGSSASIMTSEVVLPRFATTAVNVTEFPPVTILGLSVIPSAGAGLTVSQKSWTVWRSISMVDTMRTMTR